MTLTPEPLIERIAASPGPIVFLTPFGALAEGSPAGLVMRGTASALLPSLAAALG